MRLPYGLALDSQLDGCRARLLRCNLELLTPVWSALIPVELESDDEDGPIEPAALLVALATGELGVSCQPDAVLVGNATFPRATERPTREYLQYLEQYVGDKRPAARVGLDANLLLALSSVLGAKHGHVELEVRGPRKAVIVRPVHREDGREGLLMPVRLPRR